MQVFADWQGLTLEQLANIQPDTEAILERDNCSVLVQSVKSSDLGLSNILVVGDPCMDAAVLTAKRGKLSCLSCFARTGCRHVRAAQGEDQTELAIAEATSNAWADKFSRTFDTSTGQRRVTSISKVSKVLHVAWPAWHGPDLEYTCLAGQDC